jgi:hypothetical protein
VLLNVAASSVDLAIVYCPVAVKPAYSLRRNRELAGVSQRAAARREKDKASWTCGTRIDRAGGYVFGSDAWIRCAPLSPKYAAITVMKPAGRVERTAVHEWAYPARKFGSMSNVFAAGIAAGKGFARVIGVCGCSAR